jgi:N utilization substance protein A
MEKVTAMLMSRLDIDSYAAETLFNEGFESIEVIALTDRSEMLAIEGFTEEFVDKLQQRAKLVMDQDEALVSKRLEEMDPKLSKLEDMDDELLRILAREGILTLEDLGDLANDELMEMTKLRDEGRVNRLIMAARAPILES